MTICSVADCQRQATSLGWCDMHYARWRRHGDPEVVLRTPSFLGLEFIGQALTRRTDDCIVWPYRVDKGGYGKLTVRGHDHRAHIVACILAHGERPAGLEVCHDCGGFANPACVNPRHLRWGTPSANQYDRWRMTGRRKA